MAIREGLGGRRLAAVGAGVMLIGTLGAGPAFAGTASSGDHDYDYYYYSSYKCDDYKYSSYFKYGYWYDKHDGRDKPDDKPTTPQLPTDPDQLQDIIDQLIEGGFLDPGATLEDLLDLIANPPAGGLPSIPGLPTLPTLPIGGTPQVPVQDTNTDPPLETPGETPAVETQETENEVPEIKVPEIKVPESESSKIEAPQVDSPEPETPEIKNPEQSSVQESSEGPMTLNSSTSRLDDPDPKDDDKDHKGEWRHGKAKYSYTSYKCYKNVEKGHYWYDHRTPGKVEATKVRTVPKGGVDTGN